jgi:hypothetical protein
MGKFLCCRLLAMHVICEVHEKAVSIAHPMQYILHIAAICIGGLNLA